MTVVVIALADGEEEARAGAPMIGHIHGIVPDPGSDQTSGRVLIGAHYGLFAVDDDGTVTQVDEGVTDYMAVTDAGPDRLLASGHPDSADRSRPANLGLIESRDGGRTWQPRSLHGAADFHALEHASTAGRIWGIDSVSGGLVTSTDERCWQPPPTSWSGSVRPARCSAPRTAGPPGPSSPGAPGEPSALSVIGDSWYAATSEGLFRGSITPDTAGEEATRLLSYR